MRDAETEKNLKKRLALLPRQPGVYYLRDARNKLLYVGKAKNLANRVRSYFRPADNDPRIEQMKAQICNFDYVVVSSESEALILEANCVKKEQPPYNIQLKDDKRYPHIKITTGHPFPAIVVTRSLVRDGSAYFGPYTKVKSLRAFLKLLRSIFPLRNCTDRRLARDERECLEYHMGKCPAPCTRRITAEDYQAMTNRLLLVFGGKGQDVIRELEAKMSQATAAWQYEEAARCRDLIRGIEEMSRQQNMLRGEIWDADVVGLAHRGERAAVVVLSEREGRVLGREQREMKGGAGRTPQEVLEAFITQFYTDRIKIPPRIITTENPPDRKALEDWLSSLAGRRVTIRLARGSRWLGLSKIAEENAALTLEEKELMAQKRTRRVDPAVYELQKALGLKNPPYRVEGYDISNIQGVHAVGSRVTFVDGAPLKAGYRRYRIRDVEGPDDFAMMAEVLGRRLDRASEKNEALPDLILVDGGRGQVSIARKTLRSKGFEEIPVIGLAKRHEEIVGPRGLEIRRLPRSSAALKLLQRVRDEAHRFAISYHRRLRGSVLRASSLDSISGIGHSRKVALLAAFGSPERLKNATPEELTDVPGIGPQLARRIHEELKGLENSAE
ncbi:MAG: excinuclease ABC subunit UvrC [Candidatus Eisenbacteria bacterium]|uniref:UvrABC system protein C n=1 Tax=Eiseniibacteriota bacterium TaxID=2212470 RepID=A0A948RXC7_UNCEI|nr:excinuclease ABC subunit UvrC [Candidatus Eisenbacteria bacterium]MBU1949806.1 excinuclease ABC subunit UvrC [Candidatus Eisenbacteria bacterium]MBU2691696.1 excinuclease ABC subunit UvrC [Candidatus Eisenbacteria bacterium]